MTTIDRGMHHILEDIYLAKKWLSTFIHTERKKHPRPKSQVLDAHRKAPQMV